MIKKITLNILSFFYSTFTSTPYSLGGNVYFVVFLQLHIPFFFISLLHSFRGPIFKIVTEFFEKHKLRPRIMKKKPLNKTHFNIFALFL